MPSLTNKEVRNAVDKLRKLPKAFKGKELKKVYRKAARPLTKQAKRNINDAAKPVKRYDKKGNHVATYYPGNLRRSIGVLTRLKLKRAIYVGPRVAKGSTKGDFKGRRTDPYYAHIVEKGSVHQKGQHYLERAFHSTKNVVINGIVDGAKGIMKKWISSNRVK